MPVVRSDGQEEAVAASTEVWGAGGLGGKGDGVTGEPWRGWLQQVLP